MFDYFNSIIVKYKTTNINFPVLNVDNYPGFERLDYANDNYRDRVYI